jgi:hypothetical protein
MLHTVRLQPATASDVRRYRLGLAKCGSRHYVLCDVHPALGFIVRWYLFFFFFFFFFSDSSILSLHECPTIITHIRARAR